MNETIIFFFRSGNTYDIFWWFHRFRLKNASITHFKLLNKKKTTLILKKTKNTKILVQ